MKNAFAIAALCSLIPISAAAFNDQLRTAANGSDMVSLSNLFALSLEPAIYADCFHTYNAAAWAYKLANFDGNYRPDENSLLFFFSLQVIHNGMETYRSNFVRQYTTAQPLEDVVRATGGDYASANKETMRDRCFAQFTKVNQR